MPSRPRSWSWFARRGRSGAGTALGGWLHQVAHRIALQAGADAVRKRRREQLLGPLTVTDDHSPDPDEEWRTVLLEEVARLTDKYRLPILLCDLEGRTHAQAAAELNCGEATVRRRLAGARDLLRRRLIRRGVTLTIGALTTSLSRSALAKIPPGWVEATVKAAGSMSSTAARIAVGEVASNTAANLARKSMRAMLLSQLRAGVAAVVLLFALVGLAWGVRTLGQETNPPGQTAGMKSPQKVATPASANANPEKPENPNGMIAYQGRVLDPAERPVAGAELYLVRRNMRTSGKPPVRAVSGPDGRFWFLVPKSEFDLSRENPYLVDRNPPWRSASLLAACPGICFRLDRR